jgi:hypothetical protein
LGGRSKSGDGTSGIFKAKAGAFGDGGDFRLIGEKNVATRVENLELQLAPTSCKTKNFLH